MTFISTLQKELKAIEKIFGIRESDAFAAWFAKIELSLDDDEAYDAIAVEGSNDKGMDLFWVDDLNQRVLIAQCKYSSRGNYRPKVKELDTLLACTDWLSSIEMLEREGRPELVAAAKEYQDAIKQDYSVQLWFVYCGNRDENIDKRIRVFNSNPENEQKKRMARHCDLNIISNMYEDIFGKGHRIDSTKVQVDKQAIEVEGHFGKGIVTTISGSELVSLYETFGDELFARNVRSWLGARKGSVNASIIDTLESDREQGNFWAYNNGITIVCDKYYHDSNNGELNISNFSIINGCQTTVALSRAKDSASKKEVFLLIRIISPPESIIDSLIRFTNSQNLVRRWDLVSQDKTQKRLHRDFDALDNPIYYILRRGDWRSLNRKQKNKYRTGAGEPHRVIKHDLLAQYLSSFKGMAVIAYKNKAFLFDKYYEETFPSDLRVEEALFIWKAGESMQNQVREEIRQETKKVENGEREREKYVLMLKRGGRFYCLAVFGLVAKLRNGPDYLRSLTETRITSNSGSDRIEKYAKFSVTLYKQSVSDLLEITGTDLSVLIREKDFFDRLAERVTNTYDTMRVNVDWLQGALPKLY